jgi:hypothetical protein
MDTNLLASASASALSDDESTVVFVNQLSSDKAVTLVVLDATVGYVKYPVKHVVVDYAVSIATQPYSVAFAGNDVVWVVVSKDFDSATGSYADDKSYLVSFLLEASGITVTNNLSAPSSSTHGLVPNAQTISGVDYMLVGGAYADAANSWYLALFRFDQTKQGLTSADIEQINISYNSDSGYGTEIRYQVF